MSVKLKKHNYYASFVEIQIPNTINDNFCFKCLTWKERWTSCENGQSDIADRTYGFWYIASNFRLSFLQSQYTGTRRKKNTKTEFLHMEFVLTQKTNYKETRYNTHSDTNHGRNATTSDILFKMLAFSFQNNYLVLRKNSLLFLRAFLNFTAARFIKFIPYKL